MSELSYHMLVHVILYLYILIPRACIINGIFDTYTYLFHMQDLKSTKNAIKKLIEFFLLSLKYTNTCGR